MQQNYVNKLTKFYNIVKNLYIYIYKRQVKENIDESNKDIVTMKCNSSNENLTQNNWNVKPKFMQLIPT